MTIAETTTTDTAPKQALSGEQTFFLIALVLVALGAGMTILFGLPGLAMTALALVPVAYALLILISVGK
ncbi:hypothetical protein [Mameliella sediminis]|uniref:hypothetical protein n=1 Tax=Mameliella sediminis TaxID=2836866 RepID=UPI001C45C7B9|nr:hypothetical protein [Mameliella sediminis]MBY6116508.1 hypothetical protein [Antarctobacter heliothermus]MBY6145466.1 hypothetical protein [Mameliella alba]MBV7393810.1 hypothetical protein [Mameliella sediminis]MBY6160790.1 hypothetical protein [Mameliella alba]MBY6169260.1 hypothetical protein [Mameliella alba]